MSFESIQSRRLICLLLVLTTSCGIFGSRKDTATTITLSDSSTGCLNQLGPQVQDFIKGRTKPDEWAKTWNCTTDVLRTARKFARGSSAAGFTAQDLLDFAHKFLVNNRTLSLRLISIDLQLKASLLGGSPTLFSYEEIDHLIELIALLRDQTTLLIPHLANRADRPTPENLLALAEAMVGVGGKLGAFFGKVGKPSFDLEQMQILFAEVSSAFKWDFPLEYIPTAMALKEVFIGGDRDVIHGEEWSQAIQAGFRYGGLVAAYSGFNEKQAPLPNAKGRFIYEISKRAKGFLIESMGQNGGEISYDKINRVIDRLPVSLLNRNRSIMKNTFKVVNERFLWTHSKTGLDSFSLDTIDQFFKKWDSGTTMLESIYTANPSMSRNATPGDTFAKAAEEFAKPFDEKECHDETKAPCPRWSIFRLIDLARNYRPLFHGSDAEITFDGANAYSFWDLSSLHLFNLLGEHLIKSYGTGPNATATLSDLNQLVNDFGEFALEFKIWDATIPGSAGRRFREADLFTLASNGDGFLDIGEVTYYLLFAKSSFSLAGTIRAQIEPICGSDQTDTMGWRFMDVECFRREYMNRIPDFWSHYPLLWKYYVRLSYAEQLKLIINMEKGFRRGGVSNSPFGGNDVNSLTGYLDYIEAIFIRFDTNNDNLLDTDELLAAYPNFKGVLAAAAGGSDDDAKLKAAFTYTIKHGYTPIGDVWRTLDFVWWWKLKGPKHWNVSADRGQIYSIVPVLLSQ